MHRRAFWRGSGAGLAIGATPARASGIATRWSWSASDFRRRWNSSPV